MGVHIVTDRRANYVHICMCVSPYIHIHVYASVYLHVCIYVYVYTSICIHIYIYIYRYIYAPSLGSTKRLFETAPKQAVRLLGISIYPFTYLSIHFSIYLSIFLSICVSKCSWSHLTTCRQTTARNLYVEGVASCGLDVGTFWGPSYD